MVEYQSTRGNAEHVPFSEVIIEGLASDGGLYVPAAYPKMSLEELSALSKLPYDQQFAAVAGNFIGDDDIAPADQSDIARKTYNEGAFDVDKIGDVCPVDEISDGIYVQELSLGPTAAFKDMAMQPLGRYIGYVLGRSGARLPMLGATSGDTGSSAEAAISGIPGVSLAMMSRQTGMTEIQAAQMAEQSGDNIINLSVDGSFDDCQDLVKAIKADPEFNALGAVNSINWGRVAFQIPYYVAGYLQVVGDRIGDPVDFAVPTGNMGNIFAGYIAKKMGLPIRRLIMATNENSVLDELVQTGVYQETASQTTSSPSMDISKASNYERLVLDIMEGDTERTRDYVEQFATHKRVTFDEFGLPADTMQRLGFESGVSAHPNRLDSIGWVYKNSGRLIDPHTADAVSVARKQAEDGVPMVCMSTALPVKFEPTMQEALGFVPARPERFVGLEQRAARKENAFFSVPVDIDVIKSILRARSFANSPTL